MIMKQRIAENNEPGACLQATASFTGNFLSVSHEGQSSLKFDRVPHNLATTWNIPLRSFRRYHYAT